MKLNRSSTQTFIVGRMRLWKLLYINPKSFRDALIELSKAETDEDDMDSTTEDEEEWSDSDVEETPPEDVRTEKKDETEKIKENESDGNKTLQVESSPDITTVEGKRGKYDCPRFVLSQREEKGIHRHFKEALIVKLLGRNIGYKTLEACLKHMWIRQGTIIIIIDMEHNYFMVKFSIEDYMKHALIY